MQETVVKRAQQEAKREYVPGLTLTAWERIAFIKGATFAATITPVQIEAGARALRDGDDAYPDTYGDEDYREMVRAAARAMGFEVAEEEQA